MSNAARRGRVCFGLVRGEGLYYSRLVTAGPYVFMSALPVNDAGQLPPEAAVNPPYHLSPAAHVRTQTRYLYDTYLKELGEVGSSLADVVQIEQFMPAKRFGDGYTEESRSPGFLDRLRPTSANICTGELRPSFATITHTGIAISPDLGYRKQIVPASQGYVESLTRPSFGETFAEEGPFNEVIAAGPYVFTVGDTAVDWAAADVHAEAKVDDLVWWGSEIRSETQFVLKRLATYLERAGCTLDDVVHMTVYLTDLGDLFELDQVWRKMFGSEPPARTVLPCKGLGIPAFEGTGLHHRDRAVHMEQMAQSVRPGAGYQRTVLSGALSPLGHASAAVRGGPLLWTSEMLAGDTKGASRPDTRGQLELIFNHLDQTCRDADTDLSNLVRLRAFVTDPDDAYLVYAMLEERVPSQPPTVAVSAVPGPLQVPGCTVLVDAVAFIPEVEQ